MSNVKYRIGSPPLQSLPLQTDYQPTGIGVVDSNKDELMGLAAKALRANGITNPFSETSEDDTSIGWGEDDTCKEFAMNLVTRRIPDLHEDGAPTILVIAQWQDESPKTWEQAVKQIKHDADELFATLGRLDVDISVEIISRELWDRKYFGPIAGNERLLQAWPDIQEQVHMRLDSFVSTKDCVTSVAIFRIGFNIELDTNPITIYIALSYESDETGWPPVVEAIKSDLSDRGWGELLVHVEHNENSTYAFEVLPPNLDIKDMIRGRDARKTVIEGDYQDRVDLGADISAARYIKRIDGRTMSSLLGTLGCYIEIQTKKKPAWTKYALSNHHVIRPCFDGFGYNVVVSKTGKLSTEVGNPLPKSVLAEMDLKGVRPNSNPDVEMEHPSRLKHNATLSYIHAICGSSSLPNSPQTIRDIKRAAKLKERADKLAFFDEGKNVLGNVFASSGFKRRSKANSRLDWALVSVHPDRQGENRLPGPELWWATYFDLQHAPSESTYYGLLRPQGDVSFRSMAESTTLFSCGTITGGRSGYFSRFKANVFSTKEDKYLHTRKSSEYVCLGKPVLKEPTDTRFADSGDSGSVVFDTEGRIVGLLFTGLRPQQNEEGYSYVTPIEDVFEDIKAYSRGEITDIRIAT